MSHSKAQAIKQVERGLDRLPDNPDLLALLCVCMYI